MTAQEMILKGIIDEASLKSEEILKQAKNDSQSLLEDAKKQAKAFSGETVANALKKAAAIKANAESASELVLRDARLKRKNREIEDAISLAVKELYSLSDEKYFELLLKMISKRAESEDGEIFLSQNDLSKRKTGLLLEGIKKNGFKLTLSERAADIESGFVIKYGDVEINSSFEAIVAERKEQLEDAVKDVLFTE